MKLEDSYRNTYKIKISHRWKKSKLKVEIKVFLEVKESSVTKEYRILNETGKLIEEPKWILW